MYGVYTVCVEMKTNVICHARLLCVHTIEKMNVWLPVNQFTVNKYTHAHTHTHTHTHTGFAGVCQTKDLW